MKIQDVVDAAVASVVPGLVELPSSEDKDKLLLRLSQLNAELPGRPEGWHLADAIRLVAHVHFARGRHSVKEDILSVISGV